MPSPSTTQYVISVGSWPPASPSTQSLKGHQPASRPRASRRNWAASRAVDDVVVEAVVATGRPFLPIHSFQLLLCTLYHSDEQIYLVTNPP